MVHAAKATHSDMPSTCVYRTLAPALSCCFALLRAHRASSGTGSAPNIQGQLRDARYGSTRSNTRTAALARKFCISLVDVQVHSLLVKFVSLSVAAEGESLHGLRLPCVHASRRRGDALFDSTRYAQVDAHLFCTCARVRLPPTLRAARRNRVACRQALCQHDCKLGAVRCCTGMVL